MYTALSFAPGDGGSQGSTGGQGRTKSCKKKQKTKKQQKKQMPCSCSEKQRALHCCSEEPRCWCVKHTEFTMEPPLSIESPCSALRTSTMNAGKHTTKCDSVRLRRCRKTESSTSLADWMMDDLTLIELCNVQKTNSVSQDISIF